MIDITRLKENTLKEFRNLYLIDRFIELATPEELFLRHINPTAELFIELHNAQVEGDWICNNCGLTLKSHTSNGACPSSENSSMYLAGHYFEHSGEIAVVQLGQQALPRKKILELLTLRGSNIREWYDDQLEADVNNMSLDECREELLKFIRLGVKPNDPWARFAEVLNQSETVESVLGIEKPRSAKKEYSLKELKELKAQWYQNAVQNGITTMVANVCRELGKLQGDKYSYIDTINDIIIHVDDYGDYVTVHWKGRPVCNTHRNEQLFVPGSWVDILDKVKAVAEAVKQAKVEKEEENARNELRRQLWLDE